MTEGAKKKRLYLKTYGCQMNVYDSERMVDLMAPHGFVLSEEPDNSELIILNTCHIREKAAEKVYSDLGRLVPLKRKSISEGKNLKIVVAGCVAQAEGEEIIKRQPAVDIVVGPQTYHKLPELLFNNLKSSRSVVATEFPTESKFDDLLIDKINDNPTSFVSVQEGCDKFCSCCVVPYTRGAEYSRPVQDIIKEINVLVSKGAKEICLLGQNVNAYHGLMGKKSWSLSRLIKEIAEIENLKRIRYTTSHPADMTQDLIDANTLRILSRYRYSRWGYGNDSEFGYVPTLTDIIFKTSVVASASQLEKNIQMSDLFLELPTSEFGITEFNNKSMLKMIDIGYDYSKPLLMKFKESVTI